MNSDKKWLALYEELIGSRDKKLKNDENVSLQDRYDSYKSFIISVQERKEKIKAGEKLEYSKDKEFLDLLFIKNNPISTMGSSPTSHDDLRKNLEKGDFIKLIEQVFLTPDVESWRNLNNQGKKILAEKGLFRKALVINQPLRFNRICAASTLNLIPIPSGNNFDKLVNYLSNNQLIDFEGVEKNWFEQNEYLTKNIREVFKNKIADNNDFTDEYWLNLFMWSLYAEKVNIVDHTQTKLNHSGDEKMEHSLNRILYGAAGTGKTYNTINHALSIIENKPLDVLENQDRTELKTHFDQYKDQGRIKFVTFHQSFSYEDFVEGIRAETETDEQGNLKYQVKPGVFKEICEDAEVEAVSRKNKEQVPQEDSINFLIEDLIAQAKAGELTFSTKRGAEIRVTSNVAGTLFASTSTGSCITLSIRHIRNYLKDQSDIIVDHKSYEWAIAQALQSKVKYESTGREIKPYILIIDEINRGNLSRIFGELITLIEDSKRKGATEELSVTLPYSKKEFSVPQNLYIIGTMNSSDRSLTGLDIALRRRFTFIEMPPKPSLIQDENKQPLYIKAKNKDGNNDKVNIVQLLEVMNQRIEVLLDRDHCIGHANFMSLKSDSKLDELAQIFKQKIIPQLQEYFFDNWSKINLVLNNNGMLKGKLVEKSALFPNINIEEVGCFEEQKIWELNEEAFESIESFTKIIKY